MGKDVGQRLIIIAIAIVIAFVLLWPPSQKLRPGLDIAGGTSLIFEIDTKDAEASANLAEAVKTQLQKRVDPAGVYNLTWRVHGRNRIEVQMPLPPKEATARREAYAQALDKLYSFELRRGAVEAALREPPEQRSIALQQLARGRADAATAALTGADTAALRAAIEQVVATRQALLEEAARRWDAQQAAEAARARGPVPAEPAAEATTQATSVPATQTAESLQEAYRDATELFEDAMQDVLASNLNRRRFEEILELETKSETRRKSLPEIRTTHADLHDLIDDVVAKHTTWRSGKRFLDSPNDLKRLLRGAGKLEFRILAQPDASNPTKYDRYREQLKDGRPRRPQDEYGWFKVDNPLQFFNQNSPAALEQFDPRRSSREVVEKIDNDYWVLAHMSANEGLLQDVQGQRRWRLNGAQIDRDQHGRLSVSFQLDDVGGLLFGNLTRRNIDRQLCIMVDDVAYSAAQIQSVIHTHGQITGDFSPEKVSYLVQTMQGGTLQARLKDTPLSERTIGSSLGETNRDAAVRAGLIATLAVIAIMLIYYMICGAIANVAMLLNVFLTLSALAMLGARITLDGIAGLILAVGMAVDANVLIYERMREERERGGSLRMIIKNGFDRAFSTIFDSNMTTLLTCVIIYYVGSEEVKGFGLTLGWGIALNLFTAVFVTRTLFDLLLKFNLIKDVKMLKLIGVPKVDWIGKSKIVVPITVAVTLAGLALLFARGKDNVFDIEFLGGVAAEFEVKEKGLDDVAIGKRLTQVSENLKQDARQLDQVSVTAVVGQPSAFDVQLAGVAAPRLAAMLTEPLEAAELLARGSAAPESGSGPWRVRLQQDLTAEQLAAKIQQLRGTVLQTLDNLERANVNAVLAVGGVAQDGLIWNVTTTADNMRLVEHALKIAIGDEMRVQPSVTYTFHGHDERPYAITERLLDIVVPGLPSGVNADLTDYLGGAAIHLTDLNPPQSVTALRTRLENMHFQPDFQDLPKRQFQVIGVAPAGGTDDKGEALQSSVVIVTVDPDILYRNDPQTWYSGFAQGELRLVQTALGTEQNLRKVMQFKPQIAARASQQASMALVLSWAMIVVYIWIRFGKLSFGMGGVVALVHDVLLALAFVGFAGYLSNTGAGKALLIEDFKINMPIVAALLTVIGYSVNDKIVLFDRIRELRGRLGQVSTEMVNEAINQCMSRTILTGGAVLVVLIILYIWGGSSIRGFNYCMFIGVVGGTYSSISIATMIVLLQLSRRRSGALSAPRSA